MFIIPVGTKSSLALKPKVTIGLIAVNILVATITIPLGMQTEKDFFKVERDLYAREVRLYLNERYDDDGYRVGPSVERFIADIEQAGDYYDLEYAIMEALYFAGASFEDLEAYEKELDERTELYYASAFDGSADTFAEWQRLRAKEETIIDGHVIQQLGLVPNKMHRIHTFFTHQFLHGGIWHLLGNLLFLWVVGCLLEDTWGRVPFLVFYLVGGAVAGLAHCLQDTSSATALVGASGAIAAAMGAFALRHFWTKIRFFYFFIFFFRPFWGTFYLPACVFLPFWFFQQIAMKYLADFTGGSDVAYLAHIAGFLMGLVTVLIFRATDFETKYLTPRVERKQVDEGVLKDPRFNKACELMEQGKTEPSQAIFSKLMAERPHDLEMIQDIAILYREKGMHDEYARLTAHSLRELLLKSRYEEAAAAALDIVASDTAADINPQYLLRTAKYLADAERYGEAHDIYRAVIRANASPTVTAKASLALAKLLFDKMRNIGDAIQVLDEARSLPLDQDWMERVIEAEAQLRELVPAGTVV
jgi:membrane associated rhomboid family serine protease